MRLFVTLFGHNGEGLAMDRPDPLPSFHRLQQRRPLPPLLPSPSQAACYKLLMMPSWALDPRALSVRCQPCPERKRGEKERRERERGFFGTGRPRQIRSSPRDINRPGESRQRNIEGRTKGREGRGDQKKHFCRIAN